MNDTCYLISACDHNTWVWPYWWAYFKRAWDFGCGIPVYLLCESKKIDRTDARMADSWEIDDQLCYNTYCNSWSERVLVFLQRHPLLKYIIYGVEDQMLMEPVNHKLLNKLIEQMRKFDLKYISMHNDKYMNAVVIANDRAPYRNLIRIPHTNSQIFTFQCAIFEAGFLHSLMHPPEDIWQTEINGHQRVRNMRVPTYMYVDRPVIRFREVLRRGVLKPHRMKYLWAVDANDMFPKGDMELDKLKTWEYYQKWEDKIRPETVLKDWTK